MSILETIRVKDGNRRGWKIINASDFDPKVHEVAKMPGEREALEARAEALGVKFNARTKDEALAERIEAAEAGGDSEAGEA